MTNEIQVFDRNLIRKRRERAAQNFSEYDFIINLASDYTVERLVESGDKYPVALDLGCHTGQLGGKLIKNHIVENIIYCDSSEAMVMQTNGLKIVADEELLPFSDSAFNFICSTMSLHWVNDLPGTLLQIRKCLKSEGMFIATIAGINTLKELRHCLMEAEIEITGGTAPHISPFADVKTMGHLMQRAGFAKPVADSETIQISYKDMFSLMNDLKNMGENNALIKRSGKLRKDVLHKAAEKYHQLYSDADGNILATIEIITITGLAG
jgi:NADH dehydrogenase [ubiquinone] 1 alpha subcomplex assembly factor 5